MQEFYQYCIVGGMLAAVKADLAKDSPIEQTEIRQMLLNSYIADMTKYANQSDTVRIFEAYDSLPAQLARDAKKFQYKLIKSGARASQYGDAIDWLIRAGIVYWSIRILICGGCLVGAGILAAFIGIKIAGLYKKYCWDMITIMVILISMAIAIYFGDWIKTALTLNLLLLLLLVQLVYVGIRWYVKGWREARGYH